MLRVLWRTALVTDLVAVALGPSLALAQTPPSQPLEPLEPLVAARALFADALRDEDAGRFGEALEKFERVRAVRDTASIEYRIGTCHEGLGEAAPAFRAYLAAELLERGDPQSAEVSRAASDRLNALAKRVTRLTLLMPSSAPPHVELRVDDGVVAPGGGTFVLAPGAHVVSATADGARPFRSETVLIGGDQVSMTIGLAREATTVEAPAARSGRSSTPGWLAIGGGTALAATSLIVLVARHDDIADLNRACPGGACPAAANASDLESTRSRALVEGPVGVACAVAGIALGMAGAYWVASTHGSPGAGLTVIPTVARGSAGLAFSGALP